MIKKYIFRLCFYKLIDSFPSAIGHFIFFNLQKLVGQLGVKRYILSGENFVQKIIPAIKKNKFEIGVEIGTGWYPVVPVLLIKEFRNLEIFSYDLRKLMSVSNLVETISVLRAKDEMGHNSFSYKCGVDLTSYRFNEIKYNEKRVFFFSKATLQHVPKSVITEIHKNLIQQFPSHTIYHLVNCNDHRQHTDKSLSKYEFLKYDEGSWKKRHANFDFHNRMRAAEYETLFTDLGYQIINFTYDKPSALDLKDYNDNVLPKLDQRFVKFSEIENTKGSLFYELKMEKK
jgi:hypothetical protein